MNGQKNIYTLCSNVCSRGGRKIKSIIKENSIELSSPIPIGGEMNNNPDSDTIVHQEDKVEPIIENDEVVGIIHYCQCGKSTEIRFDY